MSRPIVVHHESAHGSTASYTTGFVLSIVLTLVAYVLTVQGIVSGWGLVIVVLSLGIVQLLVQLLFFLHLGSESKPRWNLMVLLFMVIMVLVIGIGSLWIMYNLDYNMGHTSHQSVNTYLESQGDL